MRPCEFCKIFKNNYLVEQVQTAVSDILVYRRDILYKIHIKEMHRFLTVLVFIHFKLILESCTTSRVYLEPYQTSMMKRFYKNS